MDNKFLRMFCLIFVVMITSKVLVGTDVDQAWALGITAGVLSAAIMDWYMEIYKI